MDIVSVDVEDLLENYNTDVVVIRFGNKEHHEPYLELVIDKTVAKDGRIKYVIKEASPTGEINFNLASPFVWGMSLKEIQENYAKTIGLSDAMMEELK
jgi:hypothetical protein